MKKILLIVFTLTIAFSGSLQAQKDTQKDWGISFSGYLKTDVIYDTRKTVDAREGHFHLYPAPEVLDLDGEDVNAFSGFNMLSIQSRLRGTITGPDALGAKTKGVLEGAFFGAAAGNINTFRLRHAFIDLDWGSSELLVGQYWNPMFIEEVFPYVVSFNTGAPFQPFARNPQIRFILKPGDMNIILAAYSQRDFTSTGPDGASSKYLRDAGIPNMFAGLKYKTKEFIAGAGAQYKLLKPRRLNMDTLKTDETIGSFGANAYLRFDVDDLIFRAEGNYIQNATDLTMIGGYAVKEVVDGEYEYVNLNTMSAWVDVVYGKEIQFGLFGGYTKNMGAEDNVIIDQIYARGGNIDNIIRVSPRIVFNSGKFRVSGEIEYTAAAYGNIDAEDKAKVTDAESVANIRALIAFYLAF